MEKLADVLIAKEIRKSEDKDIIVYGLSSSIEMAFNIITTLFFGFLLGLILESVVFLVAFSFIRTYAGGYHCKNAINCYIMSSGIVALVLLVVKLTPSEYILIIGMITLIVSVPILLKFAPIEAPHKPLDDDEQKYYRKRVVIHLVIECALVGILFLLGLYNFAFVVCMGIIVSAGLVSL